MAVFLVASAIAFLFAVGEATMEADDSWDDRAPRGLLALAIASLVAAACASVRTDSAIRPLLGPLTLVPAFVLISEHKGSTAGSAWLYAAAAAAVVIAGGVVAGGLWDRIGHRKR